MDIHVHHAQLVNQPREPFWQVTIEVFHDDGTSEKLGHLMPATAVEWKIAQFNVDAETAIRMLLAEPYMTDGLDDLPDLQPTRRAARALQAERVDAALNDGQVVGVEGVAPFMMVDPEVPQPIIAESGENDPIAVIAEHSPVSDEHIAVKRAYMDDARAVKQEVAAASAAPMAVFSTDTEWVRETPDQLRSVLSVPMPGHETEA